MWCIFLFWKWRKYSEIFPFYFKEKYDRNYGSILTIVITSLVINIIYFVLLDRLMMAAVQRRTGPYNVGYFGLLQPMDDGLKLVKNEVIIPKKSSCILFLVVPNLFFYFSLILWCIIPLHSFCYSVDFTFNIFLQVFISNLNVVTNVSSGVTSNSKYTTYGSLRIGGQILS